MVQSEILSWHMPSLAAVNYRKHQPGQPVSKPRHGPVTSWIWTQCSAHLSMMSNPCQSVLVSQKNKLWLVELTLYSHWFTPERKAWSCYWIASWLGIRTGLSILLKKNILDNSGHSQGLHWLSYLEGVCNDVLPCYKIHNWLWNSSSIS